MINILDLFISQYSKLQFKSSLYYKKGELTGRDWIYDKFFSSKSQKIENCSTKNFQKVEQKYNILVLKSDIVKTDGS